MVVVPHEGQFHKSLPAVTTAVAVSLGASLPAGALRLHAAAPGMPGAAHLWQIRNGVAVMARPVQFPKNLPAVTTAVALTLSVGLPAAAQGLPAAAPPQQLHKGVVVESHEGRFHKRLLAATTTAALALCAGLPAAAWGPPAAAHP